MKKFYLFNWILLLIGLVSYNALGQTTVNYTFNGVSGNIDENINYTTEKNNATATPAFTSGTLRLYTGSTNGNSITLHVANNFKITNVVFKGVSGNLGNAKYFVDGGNTPTSISAVDNNYSIQNLNAISSLQFQNAISGTSGHIRLTGLTLTYEAINTPPVISNKTITGTYGVLLTDGTITAINNPTSWTVNGTLPTGIFFGNGVFSGTPTQAGTFDSFVSATNDYGTSTPAKITFEIAKANQTTNHTFANISQDKGTTFSGLPTKTDQGQYIVYTSADNSIVSANGNTLSFDGIGSTTITATAVGDNNFNDYTTTFNVKSNDPNATYCFEETFDELKGVNNNTGGSMPVWDGNDNFPTVNDAFQAGAAVKLGASAKIGWITSKTLDQISGNVTVSLDVKGWSTVEGSIKVTF